MSVTRYDLSCEDCYGVDMKEDTYGDYVEWDDYAKVEAECDRLRSLIVTAYREGFEHGVMAQDYADADEPPIADEWWAESDAKAALQSFGPSRPDSRPDKGALQEGNDD